MKKNLLDIRELFTPIIRYADLLRKKVDVQIFAFGDTYEKFFADTEKKYGSDRYLLLKCKLCSDFKTKNYSLKAGELCKLQLSPSGLFFALRSGSVKEVPALDDTVRVIVTRSSKNLLTISHWEVMKK